MVGGLGRDRGHGREGVWTDQKAPQSTHLHQQFGVYPVSVRQDSLSGTEQARLVASPRVTEVAEVQELVRQE